MLSVSMDAEAKSDHDSWSLSVVKEMRGTTSFLPSEEERGSESRTA